MDEGFKISTDTKTIVVELHSIKANNGLAEKGRYSINTKFTQGTAPSEILTASAVLFGTLLKNLENVEEEEILWRAFSDRVNELKHKEDTDNG